MGERILNGNLIQELVTSLESCGIPDARTEVEIALSEICGFKRSQFPLKMGQRIENDQEIQIMDFLSRRRQREPLQHILGNWDFYGLRFKVSPDVLIPRPETEGLVELVSQWISDQHISPDANLTGIEWGAGTGCLSITLAHLHENLTMSAMEICPEAHAIATENAAAHNVHHRVSIHLSDGLSQYDSRQGPDIFISNPPYIATEDIEELMEEVREYDPRLALDGGSDGYDCYRQIAMELQALPLLPRLIALEIGADQADGILSVFSFLKPHGPDIRLDLYGRNRYFLCRT